MQTQTWTAASIKSHQSDLKQRIHELIPLKDSAFKEAHARGLGFKTQAALAAALRSTPQLSARAFSNADFISRIAELSDDITAEVVTEILDDVKFDISVVKRSERRQRADRHDDVAYDVEVTLGGIAGAAPDSEIMFHLPEFGLAAGIEPYRVDSAHDRRATADYSKTRSGVDNATLVAKLVDGHWRGGLYVYAPEHQADDTDCVKNLRAGLARAILPRLPTRVRCWIFRPDNYQQGAWRVEMRLPAGVQRFWNGTSFQFDIPELDKRLFHVAPGFRADEHIGRFVDGAWKADLYSNGIEEAENPTRLPEVKNRLLQAVNQIVIRAGYGDDGKLVPVFDDADNMVGTVQLRNGRYEAWNRTRTPERRGNSHKLLGYFGSLEESTAAVLASLQIIHKGDSL